MSRVPVPEPESSKDAAHDDVSFRGAEGQTALKHLSGQVASKRSTTNDQFQLTPKERSKAGKEALLQSCE